MRAAFGSRPQGTSVPDSFPELRTSSPLIRLCVCERQAGHIVELRTTGSPVARSRSVCLSLAQTSVDVDFAEEKKKKKNLEGEKKIAIVASLSSPHRGLFVRPVGGDVAKPPVRQALLTRTRFTSHCICCATTSCSQARDRPRATPTRRVERNTTSRPDLDRFRHSQLVSCQLSELFFYLLVCL